MGPQTQKALKDFQQQKGLDANGQLDQKTLSALGVSGSAAGGASGKSSSSSSSSSSALPWEAAARPRAALPPSRSPSRLRRPPRRAPARRSSSGVKKYRKAESREALRFSFWHTDCSSAQMRPASHSEVETLLKRGALAAAAPPPDLHLPGSVRALQGRLARHGASARAGGFL